MITKNLTTLGKFRLYIINILVALVILLKFLLSILWKYKKLNISETIILRKFVPILQYRNKMATPQLYSMYNTVQVFEEQWKDPKPLGSWTFLLG